MEKKKPGWLDEFKSFIAKGNVMSLAVGVIIGGAFTAITSSLVGDVITPLLGIITGGVDFSDLKLQLPNLWGTLDAEGNLAVNYLNYGAFINAVVQFLILAFVVFWMVKMVNRAMEGTHKKEEEAPADPPAPPEPTKEELLLTEIRDLLAEKK